MRMNVVPLHGTSSPERAKPVSLPPIVAAIDVGSTKICCMIARVVISEDAGGKRPKLKILGIGHHAATGLKGGVVVNLDEAERSIRLAVDAAERMAQCSIHDVYVNVSGGRPQCYSHKGSVRVRDQIVSDGDTGAAIADAMRKVNANGKVLLHASPVQYDLDDAKGIDDPRGMFGEQLDVDVNAVVVEPSAMRNLSLVVERCHLNVKGFVMSPYAAGRAVLAADEMELGVTLIDMGGATTSVAVFYGGRLIFADVLSIGGYHITRDLAQGLSTTIAHAERIKTLYGSGLASIYDDRETISVPLLGERGVDKINQVPRSMLTGIIRPRLEEKFEIVRDCLENSPVAGKAGHRIVLSGGASQLTGMREAAGQMLDGQIRMGSIPAIAGLPESAKTSSFAVVTGLLQYAINPDRHTARLISYPQEQEQGNGYFSRVGKWIKGSF